MKIYLASTYDSMLEMRGWRDQLHAAGHIVTAQWVDGAEDRPEHTHAMNAQMDLDDIDRAEAVVSKTLKRGMLFTGGGRHIEFGYALARGKLLFNIGNFESVFHYMPQVLTFTTIDGVIEYLERRSKALAHH